MKKIVVNFIKIIFIFVICIKLSIHGRTNETTSFYVSKLARSINKDAPLRILLKKCPNIESFTCQAISQTSSVNLICMSCDSNPKLCPCIITEENTYMLRQFSSSETTLMTTFKSTKKFLNSESQESLTSTTTTTITETEEDSKEELDLNQALTPTSKSNSDNHFGLIMGISLTSVVFLVLIVGVLVIVLMRNSRKAKYLRKQKETLELDLKLKQTNASTVATTPNSSLTPLTDFFHAVDVQPSFLPPPQPPLLPSPSPLPESTLQTSQINQDNTDVAIYLDVDENNLMSSNVLPNNQSNDKLPTYNSLFTQLSNSI